ncbi:MAG TPA: low molecular weight protein-tyrosine-phosphatase [Xanthomonadaceae bacterium]|nr:low molecular weight protein-tyrosine-phosphatase [Xanthomonadaceae bacterium]
MNILFICTGNICRSPLAEGLVRHRLQEAGLHEQVQVDSAGTHDYHVGEPPDPRAIALARSHGIDIADLRARRIAAADLDRFDLVLAADRDNLRALAARHPGGRARRALLLEWSGLGTGTELPDPYYGGPRQFEEVFELLDEASGPLIAKLRRGRI